MGITERKLRIRLMLMAVFFLFCLLISFTLGRYFIDAFTLVKVIFSRFLPIEPTWSSQVETVLFQVRLPRVIMGCVIGAGLACAGTAYQSVFQNPMVSPDVLGASAGSGLGAALGIILGLGYQSISIIAFCGGLCAVGLVSLVASRVKENATLGLVLSGMMVGSLCSAGISFIKLVADPSNTLPAITYWLMGSLASSRIQDVMFAAPLILLGMLPIFLLRWRINVLTMGDEEAHAMGINIRLLRTAVILCATLITAACVSVSGMIGWVGLVVPHFARMLVGSDCRKTLPASILLGGSFMLVVDNFARLLATSEIPIGILTAFVGAPFFLYLIIKEGNKI